MVLCGDLKLENPNSFNIQKIDCVIFSMLIFPFSSGQLSLIWIFSVAKCVHWFFLFWFSVNFVIISVSLGSSWQHCTLNKAVRRLGVNAVGFYWTTLGWKKKKWCCKYILLHCLKFVVTLHHLESRDFFVVLDFLLCNLFFLFSFIFFCSLLFTSDFYTWA